MRITVKNVTSTATLQSAKTIKTLDLLASSQMQAQKVDTRRNLQGFLKVLPQVI